MKAMAKAQEDEAAEWELDKQWLREQRKAKGP
jgi:hypothetical protein